ncbi:hypothetical protein NPIL_47591 [Nephila pilipes]|uniref:Uncharacterized protein n=1 Tax=Nephila pilipes TaxID=299642 RepID=A0A8X6NXV7_NEPPI|nr:hypothetical protein NPIL_47591 [Nephila pilipes]
MQELKLVIASSSSSILLIGGFPVIESDRGWGSLQTEMVKMILIRRYVPYLDCRNSKPWSVKGVREIFGGFPRKIALKSAA